MLSIGDGGLRYGHEGWTTIDVRPPADFVCKVPDLPAAVWLQSWGCVEMIHVLEHFCPWDAKTLLSQCFQILGPGGLLILEMPNLEYCCRKLADGINVDKAMQGIFGDLAHKDPGMRHMWGYTPKSLTALLEESALEPGWKFIRAKRAQFHKRRRDFRVEATK